MQEFNGIFNIIWYIDYFKKLRFVKKEVDKSKKRKVLIPDINIERCGKISLLKNHDSYKDRNKTVRIYENFQKESVKQPYPNLLINKEKDKINQKQISFKENLLFNINKNLNNSDTEGKEEITLESGPKMNNNVFNNKNIILNEESVHKEKTSSSKNKSKTMCNSQTINGNLYYKIGVNNKFIYDNISDFSVSSRIIKNKNFEENLTGNKRIFFLNKYSKTLTNLLNNDIMNDYTPITKYVIDNELLLIKISKNSLNFKNIGKKILKRTTSV